MHPQQVGGWTVGWVRGTDPPARLPGAAGRGRRRGSGWRRCRSAPARRARPVHPPSQPLPDPAGQWKRYFDAINRNSVYSNTYVASESEEESGPGEAAAAALAVAVIVLPLALVAWRILAP